MASGQTERPSKTSGSSTNSPLRQEKSLARWCGMTLPKPKTAKLSQSRLSENVLGQDAPDGSVH